MRLKIFILLLVSSSFCYSQKKGFYTELSLNTSLFSKTNDMDKYMKNKFSDYNHSFIVSGGIGAAIGYNITNRFATSIDFSINAGGDFKNLKEKQYKKLEFSTSALSIEYYILRQENNSLSAKIGIGLESSSFFYSRKEPVDIYSFSYNNIFMPIAITWWFDNIGLILQYNAVVQKGDAKLTGIDYSFDKSIPNVSINSFSIGIRSKISL